VHDVVVPLDLVEVDGVAEPRGLEQVAGVRPQHRHLGELVAVALEVAVVDRVEPHQRREEADVCLGDRVAHQVATIGQPGLQPVHGDPQRVVGLDVRRLGAGEAASIDTAVDVGVDALHHALHLSTRLVGPQVGGVRAVEVTPLEVEVLGDPGDVVGHHDTGGMSTIAGTVMPRS